MNRFDFARIVVSRELKSRIAAAKGGLQFDGSDLTLCFQPRDGWLHLES